MADGCNTGRLVFQSQELCDICGRDTRRSGSLGKDMYGSDSSLLLRSIRLRRRYDVHIFDPNWSHYDRLICTVCDSMTDKELEDTILLEATND